MGAQAGGRPTILGTFAAGVEDDIGVCQRNGLQTVPVSAMAGQLQEAQPGKRDPGLVQGREARQGQRDVLAPACRGPLPKPRRQRVPVREVAEKPVS